MILKYLAKIRQQIYIKNDNYKKATLDTKSQIIIVWLLLKSELTFFLF